MSVKAENILKGYHMLYDQQLTTDSLTSRVLIFIWFIHIQSNTIF